MTGLYHVKVWDQNTDQIGSYDFHVDGEPVNVDSDTDEMIDCWEIFYFGHGNLNRDGTQDYDGDDLTKRRARSSELHPKKTDTEDDGMPDGWEV